MPLSVQPLQNVGTINGVSKLPKQPTLSVAKPQAQPALSVSKLPAQPALGMGQLPQQPNLTVQSNGQAGGELAPESRAKLNDVVHRMTLDGRKPEEIQIAVNQFKSKYSGQINASKTEQPGLLKRIGQGVLRTPIQVGKAGIGLIDLLASKVPGLSVDTKSMLEQRGTRMIQSPTFGETPNYSVKEGIGKGFELGSYAIGGGGVKNVAQAGLKGLVKEGAIQGAKAGLGQGLAIGFGSGLQQEDSTIGSVVGSTVLGGIGGALTGGALGAVGGGIGAGVNKFKSTVANDVVKQADDAITYGIERGVKPSVVGKKTTTQYNNFLDRSKLAVKYITEAKDDLGLKKLPKTLDEFSDAITKAKQNIFSRYNFLSESAGQGKAKVYLDPIVKELRGVAQDPILADMAPSVAQYADDLANNYAKRGSYSTQETQRAIELFNSKLKAFYKNPNPEAANKIYVESLIVNNLRKLQDDTIQNATGQNYQALKNIYGSLADLEKEVSHRAVVVGRQNLKGLADLSDIFTSGQIIDGVLSGNPITLTKGLVGKTISTTYKALNSPDRLIANMFGEVEKLANRANKKGIKLVPNSELKTMLRLPAASEGTLRGRQPTINLSPIEQPSRVVVPGQEVVPRSRIIRPKYKPGGGKVTQIFGQP